MADLDWIRSLKMQLRVLGIEGSMWNAQRVPSLAPLEGFDLDALFLTNTIIADKSLAALHAMSGLKYLGTARNAPRKEFEALKEALPGLHCDWFSIEMWDRAHKLVSGEARSVPVELSLPGTCEIRLPPRS